MGALVIKAVVRDDDVHVTDDFYKTRRQRAAKKWGSGTCLVIRIEPEDDAYTYAQIKHYWGFIVRPFCEFTGYDQNEAHLMLKAECMPDGKTSLTELNGEELRAYSESAERAARSWCPDAFALYDQRTA